MRRRAAAVLLSLLATVALAALPGSPARAKNTELALFATTLPSMLPGQQGWVGTTWIADADVCDVQVTASGSGATVAYPANTGTYSSLFQNSSLLAGGMDFTAFNLTLSPTATGTIALTLNVSYRVVPPGHAGDQTWCNGASRTTSTETVTMPVTSYSGPAFTQQTTAATVTQKTPAWITIAFTGYAPTVTNFRVALSAPAGLKVTYPGDATSAGLNGGADLAVGYDDFASLRIDATALNPGTYTVPLTVTTGAGTGVGSIQLTVA